MPKRKTPLITDQYYHLFNKSIASEPIFKKKADLTRANQAIYYYRFANLPARLSHFIKWSKEDKKEFFTKKEEVDLLIDIYAYCLMPNHYHFLVKQRNDDGISRFLSLFQNSYAKYYNDKYKRQGPLFIRKFKAVRIETDEQLLHVSRYIHLNPFTGYLIKEISDLESYSPSSYVEYIGLKTGFVQKELILSKFKSPQDYKQFILDQADYQRRLGYIKHLVFDK